MRELIAKDTTQMRRIEQALAAAALWSPAEQTRKHWLLAALASERDELVRARSGRR
jgi:hypothetical protein